MNKRTQASPSATLSALPSGVRPGASPIRDWPLEIQLLLVCARLRLDEDHVEEIRHILQAGLDWNRFFRLTVLHRMTAFAFNHLNAHASDLIPEENLQFLRDRFLENGASALRQTAELLRLLEVLRKGDVHAVPYKGYTLAVSLYENLAYRSCIDLDILVTRNDVPRARQLLEDAGFTPQFPMSTAGREFLLRTRHSEIFTRHHGPVVELHWAFAKQRGVFPLDLDQLRPRLGEISLGGTAVPVFSPEDQLLVLCVHGANHMWSRLEWVCGISELVRRQELDWKIVRNRARELRSTKKLLLGLCLAHDLMDSPVPPDMLAEGRKDKDVRHSADVVKERLQSCHIETFEAPNSFPRDVFRLRLETSFGDRWRYVMHRLTTPSREDTRLMLPLGQRSIPLPAVLRPVHVGAKLIGDLLRRSQPHEPDSRSKR